LVPRARHTAANRRVPPDERINNFLIIFVHLTRGMGIQPRTIIRLLVKAGLAALVANEVRGLVLAGPVLYGMYQAGGTAMAIWLGFCSLAGIALSVVAPMFVARKLKLV